MQYTSNSYVAMLNSELNLGPRTRVYTNFNFTHSRSGLIGLPLDTSATVGSPAGYNFNNIVDLGTYSDLGTRRLLQIVGLEHRFAERWVTTNQFWWHDYRDADPYLFNTNGRNLGWQAGIHYVF